MPVGDIDRRRFEIPVYHGRFGETLFVHGVWAGDFLAWCTTSRLLTLPFPSDSCHCVKLVIGLIRNDTE
jgi:hypothetical protein